MKKDIIQSVKIIVLGLVVGLGISYAFAQFTPPSGPPSQATNVPGPINAGVDSQYKEGALRIGDQNNPTSTLDVVGDASVSGRVVGGGLGISGHSILVNKAFIGGIPQYCDGYGASITNCGSGTGGNGQILLPMLQKPSLFAKLSNSLGLSNEASAQGTSDYDWNAATALRVKGAISATSLKGPGDDKPICADIDGKLKVCGAGTCGPADGAVVSTAPNSSDLCSTGSAENISSSGPPYTWDCVSQGLSTSCATSNIVGGAGFSVPSCGTANGKGTISAPNSNLCSAGAVSSVTDGGINWKWSCGGIACTAPKGSCGGLYALSTGQCIHVTVPPQAPSGSCPGADTPSTCNGVDQTGHVGCFWKYYNAKCSDLTTQSQCSPSTCTWTNASAITASINVADATPSPIPSGSGYCTIQIYKFTSSVSGGNPGYTYKWYWKTGSGAYTVFGTGNSGENLTFDRPAYHVNNGLPIGTETNPKLYTIKLVVTDTAGVSVTALAGITTEIPHPLDACQ